MCECVCVCVCVCECVCVCVSVNNIGVHKGDLFLGFAIQARTVWVSMSPCKKKEQHSASLCWGHLGSCLMIVSLGVALSFEDGPHSQCPEDKLKYSFAQCVSAVIFSFTFPSASSLSLYF